MKDQPGRLFTQLCGALMCLIKCIKYWRLGRFYINNKNFDKEIIYFALQQIQPLGSYKKLLNGIPD
jgi:hypothetical protein